MSDVVDLGRWRHQRDSATGASGTSSSKGATSGDPEANVDVSDEQREVVPDSQRWASDASATLGQILAQDASTLEVRADLQRLTTNRDRTRHELREQLLAHGHQAETVDAALDEAGQSGDLDDLALAREIVDRQLHRRGRGIKVVERDLAERGIARDIIEQVTSEFAGGDEQILEAEAIARKRLRSIGGQPRAVQRQRLTATLLRKGFDAVTIETTLRTVLDDASSNW